MIAYILFLFAVCASSSYGSLIEGNYLVKMNKNEFMRIVNCVSTSNNFRLCELFSICENEMPPRAFASGLECRLEILGRVKRPCSESLPAAREATRKIFDCISRNTLNLNADEMVQMSKFEQCLLSTCGRSCGVETYYV